jgi:lipopolysaccharide/colanic/teichoic acid biosynthesis glycosyltransferase
MHVNAEHLLDKYLQGNPVLQAEWEQNQKLRCDPRVTRVGRILRQTSLDELPQLWNVLRGEMSLTGPRPIVDAEVPKYGEVYGLYKRIKPGMSGFWQVSGRSDTTYAERVEMDSYYVRNWSVWLDLIILARTVMCVVLGRGAR